MSEEDQNWQTYVMFCLGRSPAAVRCSEFGESVV